MKLPAWLTTGIVGNIFYSVLGILIAVIFYFIILRCALSTDLPMVAVVSNSMKHTSTLQYTHYEWLDTNLGYNRSYVDSWPIKGGFSMGDMPVIRGVEEYKVGDIIVYTVPGVGAPIIHRIIKINSDGTYQTKGDNNNGQWNYELSVKTEQVHGKVIFVVPFVGYVKVLFNKLLGI